MSEPLPSAQAVRVVSQSAEQTRMFGAKVGELVRAGDLILLEGELGSGKTCFVQGLGQGLGIPEAIRSPTFVLANEHHGGRLPLYHLDVYRVKGPNEAVGFGLDDYLMGDGVCVIEWADKIADVLPHEHLRIRFRYLGESSRELSITARGARHQELLDDLHKITFGL